MIEKKILLAEGEPRMRLHYTSELEKEGYRVLSAANYEETLRLLREEWPDLVILDVQLLRRGGLQTLSQILKKADSPPVILTSRCNLWYEDFRIWIAESCVFKSMDVSELTNAVRRALNAQKRESTPVIPRSSSASSCPSPGSRIPAGKDLGCRCLTRLS